MPFIVAGLAFLSAGFAPKQKSEDLAAQMGDAYEAMFNDMKLVDKGMLGISRVPNSPFIHTGIQEGPNKTQSRVIDLRAQFEEQGYDLEEGVFSNFRSVLQKVYVKPAEMKMPLNLAKLPMRISRVAYWLQFDRTSKSRFLPNITREHAVQDSSVLDFADATWSKAKNGAFRDKVRGYQIYAAPIKLSHSACLNCHRDSKLGDTIAVVALSYRKVR